MILKQRNKMQNENNQEIINNEIEKIFNSILEIKKQNELMGNVFLDGVALSINILKEISENENIKELDVSEKIKIISKLLGFSLEEIVINIIENNNKNNNEIDDETIKFITSNTNDYEKFLKENSVKESLNYLKEVI
jgi:hypothetical protein